VFQKPENRRFNSLFSRELLTRKSQFLRKIFTLAELVEELALAFSSSVGQFEGIPCIRNEIGRPWMPATREQAFGTHTRTVARTHHLVHRRMPPIKGQ